MKWFRLYNDMPHDSKMIGWTPAEKWVWVCVLCLASEVGNGGSLVHHRDDVCTESVLSLYRNCTEIVLTKLASVRKSVVTSTLDKALAAGMVDEEMRVVKWEKRQYKSDNSTPRVKAHRERSRNVSETHQIQRQIQKQKVRNAHEAPQTFSELPSCFDAEFEGEPLSALWLRALSEKYGHSWVSKPTNRGGLAAAIREGCPADCPGDPARASECGNHFYELIESKPNVGLVQYCLRSDPRPWTEEDHD